MKQNERTAAGRPVAVRPVGPPPDAAALQAAALAHLARFAATEVGLRRVLERRVARWARAAAAADGADTAAIGVATVAARQAAAAVARRMVAAGAVDDAAFASARAARLRRGGRSRRAIAAHLGAKGVDPATAAAVAPDDADAELTAALAWCRRRRVGPFATVATDDPAARRKALAALARAGFGHAAAAAALGMAPSDANDRLEASRRG